MPRPAKVKTRVLAEAQELGKLKAQRRAKKWKIPIQERILDYLERMLEHIDPLETAAVIASTIVVHEVVFNLAEFTDRVKTIVEKAGERTFVALKPILDALKIPYIDPTQVDLPKLELDRGSKGDVLLWLMAFGIAYFSIKHGDDLLAVANSFVGKSLSGITATTG